MSLFPAYAPDEGSEKDTTNSTNTADGDRCWLRNDSFIGFGGTTERCCEESSDSDSSLSEECPDEQRPVQSAVPLRRTHPPPTPKRAISPPPLHRSKRKYTTVCSQVEDLHISLDNLGFIDVDPAPSDAILRKPPVRGKKSKRRLLKHFQRERYFFRRETETGAERLDDDECLRRTEEFNVRLREDPSDVSLWLQYVRFQDTVISESRSRAEKKMSILSKALESNPSCPRLTNQLFIVMETFATPDSIRAEAKKMLSRDNRNTVAWQWMINSCLYSITELSAPRVLDQFSLALDSLFKAFPTDPRHLLDMLLQCCTFLRQAGLWEQLWMLVQLSLELNLSTPGSNAFSISTTLDQQNIRETEDEVIVSGLPLGSLWLRLEYLRTCVHFLPLSLDDDDGDNDDAQRLVFSSDVAALLHPVNSSHTARLLAVLLTSLKVPLMPVSQSGVEYVGLERVPWGVESPELLLATLTHPYLLGRRGDGSCVSVCSELLVSPQCVVEDRPGSREMLESVDRLFERILAALASDTHTRDLIALWRMRWYRLLGYRRCKERAMQLLQGFPHCLPLYTEYALLAASAHPADTATSLKVLDRAVKHAGSSPLHAAGHTQRRHLAHLYKTYIELLITLDPQLHRSRMLKLMYKLTTGQTLSEEALSADMMMSLRQRFDAVTKEMLIDLCSGSVDEQQPVLDDILLPPAQVSWFACHTWFLHVVDSPTAAKQFLESVCGRMREALHGSASHTLMGAMLESCYETLLFVIEESGCAERNASLRVVLQDAAQLYPNNLYMLHVASSLDVLVGRWWSVSPVFLVQSSVFTRLFTILVYRQKMYNMQNSVSEVERTSWQRRLYGLVRRTVLCAGAGAGAGAGAEGESTRCPLLWRLLLQFVAAQHPSEIKSTLYRALDLCPWVKSIYYDGGKMLPEELGQLQDLMIEKELRIHITCEELEILRQEGSHQPPPPS